MGCSVQFYTVDLPKLKRACGDRDPVFFRAIRTLHAREIASHDASYARQIEDDDWPTMVQLLAQLLCAELVLVPRSEFGYGHALEILCARLGRKVVPGQVVYDIPRLTFETAMMRNGPPIPLPIYRGFPEIGHLSAREVKAELAALSKVPDPACEKDSDTAGFRQALQEAADAGWGLVSFRY